MEEYNSTKNAQEQGEYYENGEYGKESEKAQINKIRNKKKDKFYNGYRTPR